MSSEENLTSAIEINAVIRQLIEDRELLNVAFNQGRDGMTTLLLDADSRRGILVFDASRDESTNRKLVSADKVVFSGSMRGTKIRFSSIGAKEIQHRGYPALSIRFPAALLRTQHRSAFRVTSGSAYCTLPIPGKGMVKAPIADLSVGGALLTLNSSAASGFTIGQTLSGCEVHLGSFGKVSCKLEVRTIKLMPSRMTGVGCRFVSLPTATEAQIARFIAQHERKGSFFDF